MKKRIMFVSLALVLVLGLSGTLILGKSKLVSGKEGLAEVVSQEIVFGLAPLNAEMPPPIIEGEKDWDVYQGEEIDVLTGVTAKDYTSQPVKVTVSSFSTAEIGAQEVVLTAEDDRQNKVTERITVHVKAPAPSPETDTVEPMTEVANEVEFVSEEVALSVAAVEPVAAEVEEPTPREATWAPGTMYLGGTAISYQNAGQGSGQGVIDSNPNVIATWGGAATQSGSDGANTHFIGHNPGIFNILFALGVGSEIIVTDGAGVPTSYVVYQLVQVDDYATRMDNGVNISDEVIGAGGGERITLQTCVNDDVNLIVMASAV